MDNLPDEIVLKICILSHLRTQKTLRLVCKRLAEICAEAVFETVYLALVQPSFKNILRIAQSKHRFHVKELIFCGENIIEEYDFTTWRRLVDQRPAPVDSDGHIFAPCPEEVDYLNHDGDFSDYSGNKITFQEWQKLPRLPVTTEKAKACFTKYEKVRLHHVKMLLDGATGHLRALLHALPKVHRVHITNARSTYEPCLPCWSKLKDSLTCPILGILRDRDPRLMGISTSECEADWGVEQLSSTLEAMAVDNVPITSLTCSVDLFSLGRLGFYLIPRGFKRSQLVDNEAGRQHLEWIENKKLVRLEKMAVAMINITFLDLRLTFGHFRNFDSTGKRVASIFGSAKNLERLWISVLPTDHAYEMIGTVRVTDQSFDFLGCLARDSWPKLRYIAIRAMVLESHQLTNFLECHATTLKHLRLSQIGLVEFHGRKQNRIPTHRRVFPIFYDTLKILSEKLSLDKVEIERIFESGEAFIGHIFPRLICSCKEGASWYAAVCNYVIHGTPELILDADEWDDKHPNDRSRCPCYQWQILQMPFLDGNDNQITW